MHAYAQVHALSHAHAHARTHEYTHTLTYTHKHTQTHTHTRMRTHTHMRKHTHTHKHTHDTSSLDSAQERALRAQAQLRDYGEVQGPARPNGQSSSNPQGVLPSASSFFDQVRYSKKLAFSRVGRSQRALCI
jgi:hypothetical protein